MIREVVSPTEGHVYGLTKRGFLVLCGLLSALSMAAALTVVTLVLALQTVHSQHADEQVNHKAAVAALKTAYTVSHERADSIMLACEESNRRHAEASPALLTLVAAGKPRSEAEAAAIYELIRAVKTHSVPKTADGKLELRQYNRFVDLIAPAYNCTTRLRSFTE